MTLETGFPRKIALETGRKWMQNLGFEVVIKRKGTYVDGHERDDFVEYRKSFLRKVVGLGFLNESNAPTDDAKKAIPTDLDPPQAATIEKTVLIFHDEATFQAYDDQLTFWASKENNVVRPKSKGSGIMVSDFITERDGYLALSTQEYEAAKEEDPTSKKYVRQHLKYGEGKEGYWTFEKCMEQIKSAVKIAERKYPQAEGW